MIEKLQPIKMDIIYGNPKTTNSLKAYIAERELKKAVKQHKYSVQNFLHDKYKLPFVFTFKKLESIDREEYSLLDIINSKLTNTSISVCLSTYEVFQRKGIEEAIAHLHLQSNLTNI